MEKEFEILSSISRNANITQRELSEKTGVSLGNVNILLKRLVKKGMLKAERINSRTIRYILTPSGLKAVAKRTYDFIVMSYRNILSANEQIKNLTLSLREKGKNDFILCGKEDEFFELIIQSLKEIHQPYSLFCNRDIADIMGQEGYIVYTWGLEESESLHNRGILHINLVDMLGK